eukprot:g5097.t1
MYRGVHKILREREDTFEFSKFHTHRVPSKETPWPSSQAIEHLVATFEHAGYDSRLGTIDFREKRASCVQAPKQFDFIESVLARASSSAFALQFVDDYDDGALMALVRRLLVPTTSSSTTLLLLLSPWGKWRSYATSHAEKQDALLPLLRVACVGCTEKTRRVLRTNEHRLVAVGDVLSSLSRWAIDGERKSSNHDDDDRASIFHTVVPTTRDCRDAGIDPSVCLCAVWTKISRSPMAMVEDVIGKANNELEDRFGATCKTIRLSTVHRAVRLSRSILLSSGGSYLFTRRYRLLFDIQNRGRTVQTFRSDVVEYIWHFDDAKTEIARRLQHVFRTIDFAPHGDRSADTRSKPCTHPDDNNNDDDDDRKSLSLPPYCICQTNLVYVPEVEDVLGLLYHRHMATRTTVVSKKGIEIVRNSHAASESFYIKNNNDGDVVVRLALREVTKRGPMTNVVTSNTFPIARLVPTGKWRYFATLERGNVRKGWNWSLRYRVLNTPQMVAVAAAATAVTDGDFSAARFSSSVVEYENIEGVVLWREVTGSADRGIRGDATIAAVRIRNERHEVLEVTVRLDFLPREAVAMDGSRTLKRGDQVRVSIRPGVTKVAMQIAARGISDTSVRRILRETRLVMHCVPAERNGQ